MKKRVRKQIRKKLAELNPTVLHAKSMAACKRLITQPEFERARVVMLYLSMPGEVDTAPLALRGWQDQKTVSAPKCSWDHRRIVPLQIHSMEAGLVATKGALREPEAGEPVPLETLDLVVVPGMAFDRRGNRLGRGAGFYDRFLASPQFRGTAVGLAFREQVLEQLPVRENDVPVHMLVTDEEVLRFSPAGQTGRGREPGSKT